MKKEQYVDPAVTQHNYSVTGKLMASTALIAVLGGFGSLFVWWLDSKYGSMGPVMFFVIVLLVMMPLVYVSIGTRAADRAQENTGKTIASVAQLTKAQNASVPAMNQQVRTTEMEKQFELRQKFEQWKVQQKQLAQLPDNREQEEWLAQVKPRRQLEVGDDEFSIGF